MARKRLLGVWNRLRGAQIRLENETLRANLATARSVAEALQVENETLRANMAAAAALQSELATLQAQLDDKGRRLAELGRQRARTAPVVQHVPHLEHSLETQDFSTAIETLRRFGCLIMRGSAQSEATIRGFRRWLDDLGYNALPAPRGGGCWVMQPTGYYRDYLATEGIPMKMPANDRLAFPLQRMVQQLLYDFCAAYYDTTILMTSFGSASTLRTVGTPGGKVAFHQDISPVDMTQSLTFWSLVDPDSAGVAAPGLLLVVSDNGCRTAMVDHDTHSISDLRLDANEYFWAPEIRVGDIVIFDPFVAHGSFVAEGMTRPRTSLDFRVAPFIPIIANSFLTGGHGLAVFDRHRMIAPTRLISPAPEFDYGYVDDEAPSPELDAALELARTTPWSST